MPARLTRWEFAYGPVQGAAALSGIVPHNARAPMGATRSEILRSMIVGAALAECDRFDALDGLEPSVDALVDV